jgi:two-component system phosphate regulon sensor histidine kinase PhoR
MTHEFKTPLSSILLASNYLSNQKAINENEKLDRYTQIIINQSHKLNQHIEKVLNIAKSDNSSLNIELNEIKLIETLKHVIENIKLKHDDLLVTITNQHEYIILADEFHFTNIIYNLLDNSIKYCNQKPKINIEIFESNGKISLLFIDNGIGVETKNLNFIFDKFYRISTKKSNEVNGFGLGLYYVKKICTQHKWKIKAKSNLSDGLTIEIFEIKIKKSC